ncbi:MAG: PIG-L family deacetylase [Actinobacteria bacterium]|nr:PIG-L family deacetylase [Actinomycetota bacterium]
MSPGDRPSVDLPTPARVLAVGAHPDDIEFGCGATLAKWGAAGAEVHLLVLTDGSKGTWDPATDPAALAATRVREQDDARRHLGAVAVHHTDYVDGELVDGPAEREAVCAVIRRTRPTVLLTHDPWKRYRLHPDHRAAGFLVLDAAVAARDPHFFPEQGLDPHRPALILLFEADDVDHYERVADTFGTKVDALLAHRSQWQSTMDIDAESADADAQRAAFVDRLRREVAAHGAVIGDAAAEGFKRIDEV